MGTREQFFIKDVNSRPKRCPLRPVPMRRKGTIEWVDESGLRMIPVHEPDRYGDGWNDCVEFIEGDSND